MERDRYMNNSGIVMSGSRTDLAVEMDEDADKSDSAYSGVIVRESTDGMTGIKITELDVTTSEGERLLGKEMGRYVTVEAPDFGAGDSGYDECLIQIISDCLAQMLAPITINNRSVLVIGLGNRDITADSLGPLAGSAILVNRHIYDNRHIYGKNDVSYRLSALVPGVMGQTGMETSQIVKGIVATSKPGAVIVIDALAARNIRHLNATFQISDRGIRPGSGVGNHRDGITEKTVGVPVVSIGMPTVIEMNNMFVTPKDVDILVKASAQIIADAVNETVYARMT